MADLLPKDSTSLALLALCSLILIKFLITWLWRFGKFLFARALAKIDKIDDLEKGHIVIKETVDDHERRITNIEDDEHDRTQSGL